MSENHGKILPPSGFIVVSSIFFRADVLLLLILTADRRQWRCTKQKVLSTVHPVSERFLYIFRRIRTYARTVAQTTTTKYYYTKKKKPTRNTSREIHDNADGRGWAVFPYRVAHKERMFFSQPQFCRCSIYKHYSHWLHYFSCVINVEDHVGDGLKTRLLFNSNSLYTPERNKRIIVLIIPFNVYNYSNGTLHQPRSISFFRSAVQFSIAYVKPLLHETTRPIITVK